MERDHCFQPQHCSRKWQALLVNFQLTPGAARPDLLDGFGIGPRLVTPICLDTCGALPEKLLPFYFVELLYSREPAGLPSLIGPLSMLVQTGFEQRPDLAKAPVERRPDRPRQGRIRYAPGPMGPGLRRWRKVRCRLGIEGEYGTTHVLPWEEAVIRRADPRTRHHHHLLQNRLEAGSEVLP